MGHVTSNLALYSALVGAFLPVVIAAIQQWHWPDHVRALVAFAACAIAAAGTAWLEGDFTARGVVAGVLIVLTTARATYASLWKPTGVVDHVEAKTSGTTVQKVRQAKTQRLAAAIGGIASADAEPGQRVEVVMRPADIRGSMNARELNAHIGEGLFDAVGPEPEPIPEDADPLVALARE